MEGLLANNSFCPLSLPPLLPLTSAAWNSHVQVLHLYPKNLICMDFGYIISVSSPSYAWPLAPFNARKSSWQHGVWAPQSPALYPCTVSVPWILFFLGYSWCEDNLHILLYYLELSPHFGGEKKKSKAKQTNGDRSKISMQQSINSSFNPERREVNYLQYQGYHSIRGTPYSPCFSFSS